MFSGGIKWEHWPELGYFGSSEPTRSLEINTTRELFHNIFSLKTQVQRILIIEPAI